MRSLECTFYLNVLLVRKLLPWQNIFVQQVKILSEAVAQRCSVKKVFLKISQNSQENTCTRDSFLIKLQLY